MEKILTNKIDGMEIINNKNQIMSKIQKAKNELELVSRMRSIKCKFMETGLKKQEMEFYYCECDPNKDSPICVECAKCCHANHTLSLIQKDFQVCSCGMKNHIINDVKNAEYAYQKSCSFVELYSKNYFDCFYENSKNLKICVFCHFFCFRDYNIELEEFDKKQINSTMNNFTNCNCPTEKHSDKNIMFEKLELITEKEICSELNISPLKMFNLIFNCEKSFNNMYKFFIDTSKNIKSLNSYQNGMSNNPSFDVDKKILNTNFYRSLKNFNAWIMDISFLYYFNSETQNHLDNEVICNLLNEKLETNKTTFSVLNFILFYYQKVHLGNFFNSIQNFKVKDYQNMSVWQRVCILNNFKKEKNWDNKNSNFLDNLLNILFKSFINFNSDVNNYFIGLPFIIRISSIVRKLAKFYLVSEELMIKYCKIIEKTLKNLYNYQIRKKNLDIKTKTNKDTQQDLSKKNIDSKAFIKTGFSNNNFIAVGDTKNNFNKQINEDDAKNILLKNILKTLLYFSFMKNDNSILSFFENTCKNNIGNLTNSEAKLNINITYSQILFNEKMIFSQCELGNEMSKNLTDIMEVIKNEEFSKENRIMQKIFEYTNQLTTIIIMKDDWYLENLINTKEDNLYTKLSIFTGVASNIENNIFDTFQRAKNELENKYSEFYNFKCSLSDLLNISNDNVLQIIMSYGLNNKGIPNLDNISITEPNENKKDNENNNTNIKLSKNEIEENPQDKMIKVAAISTNYINALLKLFVIIKLNKKVEDDYINERIFTWEKFSNILKILYFIIHNRPDNCIMIFTNHNIYSLANVPLAYLHKVLDFFIYCLNTIINKNYKLSNIKIIIQQIFYLSYKVCESNLPEELNNKILFKILKILKILSQNFDYIEISENRAYLREELKTIFLNFPLIINYKKELLKISEEMKLNNNFSINNYNNNSNYMNENQTSNNIIIEKQNNNSKEGKESIKYKNFLLDNEGKYNIFSVFISLINDCFDENAINSKKSEFENYLNLEEIQKILKIYDLGIELRTEILKFFRMIYIDIYTDHKKMVEYRYIITREHENVEDSNIVDDMKVFSFYEKLMSISENNKIQGLEYDIFNLEIDVFKKILESYINVNRVVLFNYFENGLIWPIKLFLNKIFSCKNELIGIEIIKVQELAYKFLLLLEFIIEKNVFAEFCIKNKKYSNSLDSSSKHSNLNILENDKEVISNYLNKKDDNLNIHDVNSVLISNKSNPGIITSINLERLDKKYIEEIRKQISYYNDKNFQFMDLNSISQILINILGNIIKKPSSPITKFSEESETSELQTFDDFIENEKKIYTLEESNIPLDPIDQKIMFVIAYYKFLKNSESESSLSNILNDNHPVHEVSYRSVILGYLFKIIQNNKNFNNKEIQQSAYIILNFLQKDTSNSQKDLLNLLNMKSKIIDLNIIIEYFFKNFISLIFTHFNPSLLCLSDEYNICCLIIKNFKFFCEEHNQDFQEIFLTKLSFFIEDNKKIMFYDLMIMIIDKISFISLWYKNKMSESENLDYFCPLFFCIMDMLIEIIQGTKQENFNLLYRKPKHNNDLEQSFEKDNLLEIHEIEKKDNQSSHTHNQSSHNHHNKLHHNNHHTKMNESRIGIGKNTHFDFKAAKMLRTIIDPTIESGLSLEIFIKHIKPILFNVNAKNKQLYEIRKIIANFFLAFIEENSCLPAIKDLIISQLPSSMILKSISFALKKYYLDNKNDDNYKSLMHQTITHGGTMWEKKSQNQLNKGVSSNFDKNMKNHLSEVINSEEQIKKNPLKNNYLTENEGFIQTKSKKFVKNKPKALKFFNKICDFFINNYYENENFSQQKEFELSATLYIYFKLNVLNGIKSKEKESNDEEKGGREGSEEYLAFWNKINNLSESSIEEFDIRADNDTQINKLNENKNINSNFEESDFEYYYIIKFFEKICKNVSIVLNDNHNTIVVFLESPIISNLSVNSIKEFERTVNRDSRYSKLYSLILQTEYFLEEIKFNSQKNSLSNFLKFSNKIDYQFIGTLVFLFSFIVNISLMGVLQDGGKSYFGYDSIDIIKYVTISIILYNFVFIILWIISKLPLYYKIEVIKFKNKLRLEGRENVSVFEKALVLIDNCILKKSEINLLIWIFICMLAGEVTKTNSFAYSIALLSVVNLSQVFNNIFLSVTIKWKSLVWTIMFTFVIMYIFACWGYFYENDRFEYSKVVSFIYIYFFIFLDYLFISLIF